jgi:hypothetical protein
MNTGMVLAFPSCPVQVVGPQEGPKTQTGVAQGANPMRQREAVQAEDPKVRKEDRTVERSLLGWEEAPCTSCVSDSRRQGSLGSAHD